MHPHPTGRSIWALILASALAAAAHAGDVAMLSLPDRPSAVPPPKAPAAAESNLIALFTAIADFDKEGLRLALNGCENVDAGFPDVDAASALRARFSDGDMEYYLRREPGYSPLMFASALGNETAVRFLLAAGANPNQLSRKSRTFALWQAAKNGHVSVMKLLMGLSDGAGQYRVTVDLSQQQAVVWKDKDIVMITPISSGKPATPTRQGTYLVTDKYRNWTSNLYEARMPYFLRLSCGDFGLHAGNLPGYPASHGCVRLPEENAKQLYSMLPIGTLVEIK